MNFLRILSLRNLFSIPICFKRSFHAECLHNRSLVKVSGEDIDVFLQGIMTNDINHFSKNIPSIYTMFLNVQGRVLFDGILYKAADHYIIDCDSQAAEPLINHMKLYKVRRKITLESLDHMSVWVIFNNYLDLEKISFPDMEHLYLDPKHRTATTFEGLKDLPSEVTLSRDPRLWSLGDRVILPTNSSPKDYADITVVDGVFQTLRYKLGVGEGINDLERGKCLPLEANCDYLHGVSFQKGCYIGQELTARTHHTGILRKRLMPLVFEKAISIDKNVTILNEKGKNVGKVISCYNGYGIGLLRIVEALNAQSLKVADMTVKTFRPGWWPLQAAKGRQSSIEME